MAFVAPFLMGAIGEVQRQRQETDDITGKIVDTVAPYILNKIFDAEKLSEKQTKLFNGYSNRYGANFAQVIANANLLESGDEKEADALIKNYFGTDDLLSIKKMVDEKAKDSKSFQKLFGQNPITTRQRSIKDKKEFINEQFSDRANLKRLMIDPEQKRSGLSGFLFGDRITQEDVPGATQRLAEGLQIPTTELAGAPSQDISTFLGIKPFNQLSYLELRGRSDSRSLTEANRLYTEGRQAFKDKFLAKGVIDLGKDAEAEFRKIKTDYELKNKEVFPYDMQEWYFTSKFFPRFLEQQGRTYAPVVAAPITQPATTAKTTEKTAVPTSEDITGLDLNINPRSPKYRLQLEKFVEKQQDKYKNVTPDSLVDNANTAISKLQKSNLPEDVIDQRVEFIRSVTRLQLSRLGVEPKDYGY